jgi:hypothetical protein
VSFDAARPCALAGKFVCWKLLMQNANLLLVASPNLEEPVFQQKYSNCGCGSEVQ